MGSAAKDCINVSASSNRSINSSVPARVTATAQATPDAIALEFEGRALTYGELDVWSNRLARILVAHGVRRDVLVGVLAERSLETVVSVLAVLKAGGAYVPLDPMLPKEGPHLRRWRLQLNITPQELDSVRVS